MNIHFMEYYYENKEATEREFTSFASQVQSWKESGVLHDSTFEKCKTYATILQDEINQMEFDKTIFMNCVSNLSDTRFQQVITERHVYNKKWSDVADKLKLSSQHIQNRIYPAALNEFVALLETCNGD